MYGETACEDAVLAEELDERVVLRQALESAIGEQGAFLAVVLVVACHEFTCLGEQSGHQLALLVVDAFHVRLKALLCSTLPMSSKDNWELSTSRKALFF